MIKCLILERVNFCAYRKLLHESLFESHAQDTRVLSIYLSQNSAIDSNPTSTSPRTRTTTSMSHRTTRGGQCCYLPSFTSSSVGMFDCPPCLHKCISRPNEPLSSAPPTKSEVQSLNMECSNCRCCRLWIVGLAILAAIVVGVTYDVVTTTSRRHDHNVEESSNSSNIVPSICKRAADFVPDATEIINFTQVNNVLLL